MPDRIPPRREFEIRATVSGTPRAPIFVGAPGGAGGAALTINGQKAVSISASTVLKIKGMAQSASRDDHLALNAQHAGAPVGRSNSFYVAAIPRNVQVTDPKEVDGRRFVGMTVINAFESDSGLLGDLSEVGIGEVVEEREPSGVFEGVQSNANPNYVRASSGQIPDAHTFPRKNLTQPSSLKVGQIVTDQVLRFKDDRIGIEDLPVPRSGFRITRRAAFEPVLQGREMRPCLVLTTAKVGQFQRLKRGSAVFSSLAGSSQAVVRIGIDCALGGPSQPPSSTPPGGGFEPLPPRRGPLPGR
jgi:hypothetical protein